MNDSKPNEGYKAQIEQPFYSAFGTDGIKAECVLYVGKFFSQEGCKVLSTYARLNEVFLSWI
jgi:hypothetical protein